MVVRVVLAEDNYLVREGVGRLISSEPDLELVASCADHDALLQSVDAHRPDVVVTDIRMPPTGTDEGIRAAVVLRDTHPDIGVVLLSQYTEPAYALSFLEGGSKGRAYLLKEKVSNIDQLAEAIREVARGGSVIDPDVVDALWRRGPGRPIPSSRRRRGNRDPGRDGDGQEQCGCGVVTGALGTGGGEAHQLHFLEAVPLPGAGRPPTGQGRPGLPRDRRPDARRC